MTAETASAAFARAARVNGAAELFANPVPSLSAKNTLLIRDDLLNGGYDYVVEYGLGPSTFYFFDALLKAGWQGEYIAVENAGDWFDTCVTEARRRYGTAGDLTKTPWTMGDIRTFLSAPVTSESRGLRQFQAHLRERHLGFDRSLVHRIARKVRRHTGLAMLEYKLFPSRRPQEAMWRGTVRGATLRLALSSMPGADQYGESPFRDRYVDCGTKVSGKVVVLIDGGPRMEVLTRFLQIPNATIFLCDAQREYFQSFIKGRGEFLRGSTSTLAGKAIYDDERKYAHEVWRYP